MCQSENGTKQMGCGTNIGLFFLNTLSLNTNTMVTKWGYGQSRLETNPRLKDDS